MEADRAGDIIMTRAQYNQHEKQSDVGSTIRSPRVEGVDLRALLSYRHTHRLFEVDKCRAGDRRDKMVKNGNGAQTCTWRPPVPLCRDAEHP